MAPSVDFSGCTIVVAHPDDEVLWMNSILAQAGRAIFCFGDVAGKRDLSEGRRRLVAGYPLGIVESLEVPESGMFGAAAWPLPVETRDGLAMREELRARKGAAEERYRANFARVTAALRDRLAGCQVVVTHNPWGEYGHEEHVQVFRAVETVRREQGFALWVSGYCSNASAPLMWKYLPGLGRPTSPIACDPELAAELKALYTETGCWTWFDDYVWPEWEIFYPWNDTADVPRRAGSVRPLNMIWRDWGNPRDRSPAPLRRLRLMLRWATGSSRP